MPDAAWVIVAASVFLAVAVAGLLVWRKGLQSFQFKAGPVEFDLSAVHRVEAKVDEVREAAERIEGAVNHVTEGEPPLIERVRSLERTQARQDQRSAWTASAIHVLAQHLGVAIPPPPPTTTEDPPS
jgi:hypothetical protein